ncbi:MAG: hydroxyacid dehydrogenase [Anaerolineae bacterium]
MPTILLEVSLIPEALALLEGFDVRGPQPRIASPDVDLRGVNAIIISSLPPIDTAFLERAPDLRVVGRPGIGIDNIVVPDCTAAGVLVVHTPDAPTESTAEHAVALIFAIARKLVRADTGMRTQGWAAPRGPLMGVELRGKTLGVVGLGRIGSRVAHIMGAGVGMRVVGYDPYLSPDRAASLGVRLAPSILDVLREADVVSLHSPATAETRHLMNAAAFAAMKPGALLVNCSRGPVVDEAALLDALNSGQIAAVGLDVFDPEPPLPGNPLLTHPNVLATPHIASFTVDGVRAMHIGAAEEVAAALRGERPRWLVNGAAWPGRPI